MMQECATATAGAEVKHRVRWTEERRQTDGSLESYFTIADFDGDEIRIAERSSWEVCWFNVPVTPDRAEYARSLLRKQAVLVMLRARIES